MFRLRNGVQPYAWGSRTSIADLLGVEPSGGPQAELWIGAHPALPSEAETEPGRWVPLGELIERDPQAMIGSGRASLGFLMKVMAVAAPLSVQLHPNESQAEEGFDREERTGMSVGGPNRSYRDRNAKPEVLCALTRFDALCGLRPAEEAAEDLRTWGGPRLRVWADALTERGDAGWTRTIGDLLTLPVAEQRLLVDEIASGPAPAWLAQIAHDYPVDAGVIVAAVLRRYELEPGEALFLEPGVLHAYLEGVGIEVLGESDNVVRGGLTPKHVDVPELLRLMRPVTTPVAVLRPSSIEGIRRYEFDAPFSLLSIEIVPERLTRVSTVGPAVALCIRGSVALRAGTATMELQPGESVFVPRNDGPIDAGGSGLLIWAGAAGT